MRKRLAPPSKFVAGVVTGAGVITSQYGDFTVQRTALGAYVITFPEDFKFIAGFCTPYNWVVVQVNGTSPTNDHSMNVATSTPSSGATADGGFYFHAWGR